MLLVARKNLFAERTRLAISVGGVALSVFLIGILLSLYRGWSQQVGGFVENVPADLWAASDGTTDFVAAGSVLPDSLGVQLRLLPEAETVSPLIVRPMEIYRSGDKKTDTFDLQLVGYDPEIGLGGPLEIADGKSPPGPGEIVVDIEMGRTARGVARRQTCARIRLTHRRRLLAWRRLHLHAGRVRHAGDNDRLSADRARDHAHVLRGQAQRLEQARHGRPTRGTDRPWRADDQRRGLRAGDAGSDPQQHSANPDRRPRRSLSSSVSPSPVSQSIRRRSKSRASTAY